MRLKLVLKAIMMVGVIVFVSGIAAAYNAYLAHTSEFAFGEGIALMMIGIVAYGIPRIVLL